MALSLLNFSTQSTQTTPTLPTISIMTRDPNRRVRFVLDGHPSPVSTSSTLSSPGPRTPQQLYQPLVHVRQPSSTHSPSISPNRLALSIPSEPHGALAFPPFDFDVSLDPAVNPVMCNNMQLRGILNEPATNPPLSSLTLISRDLPWEIIIRPSTMPYVTISDFLGGLYRALRLGATREEFGRESQEKRDAVATAYYNRFERHTSDPQLMEREKQKGVKRVDFLSGAHRFRGISKTDRPDVWVMKFKH